MNYWLLTSEYPPFYGGGISTYCYFTARMLAKKGHAVTVFVNDTAVSDYKEQMLEGVRVVRFNPSFTGSSAFLGHVTNISYEFAFIVKRFIEKEGRPDIIEAQEYLGIAYYLLQFKHLSYDWCKDIPVLITMHSPSFLYMEYNHIPVYRYPNYWICEMERFCLQAADQIISPSQFMIDELNKRFELTNKAITVIPNPYSITGSFALPPANENADQIVFYGKLTAQKGAFKLLQYFQDLWDQGFDRELYVLGGQDIVYHPEGISMGDLIRKKYRKYIQAGLLKLEDRIAPNDVPARLAQAELVIVPSNNDNLPYVVFEMMALGKILLISKQGGHTEVVRDGVEGFVFDHEQPSTFGQQLNHILKLSRSERDKISGNTLRRVRDDYNEEVVYAQKIKVVATLLQRVEVTKRYFPFIRLLSKKEQGPPMANSVKGKLSVVIPFYNMGKYLDETIQSVEESDYPNKEIIIINDGSTDVSSIELLNKYRNRNSFIVVDIPNQGLANARNYGAEKASGEFVAFLDADDKVSRDYHSKAIRILMNNENVHFVGCWIRYFGDSRSTWPSFLPEPPLMLYHNMVNSSSLTYRRQSFLSAGLNDRTMIFQGLEDYESTIRMLSGGYAGVVIPEALFQYRIRPDSMIRAISKEKKLVLYQFISEKYKRFYANFASDLFNLQNANGPAVHMDNPSLDHHLADKIPFGGKFSLKLIQFIKKNKHTRNLAYKVYRLLNK